MTYVFPPYKLVLHWAIGVVIFFIVLAAVIGIRTGFPDGLRASAGILALLIPGAALSFALWPSKKFDIFERILTTLILSIVTLPLVAYILYRFGLQIGVTNTVISGLIIIVLSAGFYFCRNKLQQRAAAKHSEKAK